MDLKQTAKPAKVVMNILYVWVLKSQKKKNTRPIMYWISKMYKNLTCAPFIIASKICSSKQIFKSASKIFKLTYSRIKNFHKNAKLLSNYNRFWVLRNNDPTIKSSNNINKKNLPNILQHMTFHTTCNI